MNGRMNVCMVRDKRHTVGQASFRFVPRTKRDKRHTVGQASHGGTSRAGSVRACQRASRLPFDRAAGFATIAGNAPKTPLQAVRRPSRVRVRLKCAVRFASRFRPFATRARIRPPVPRRFRQPSAPSAFYRKPRPLPFRRHRSPVYPASRPPFDRAPRNRSRDRFGNVTRASRGDRVPEASAPVSLSGNRSTAPPPSASRGEHRTRRAAGFRQASATIKRRAACQSIRRPSAPVSGQAVATVCRQSIRQAVTPEASAGSMPPDSGQCQRTPRRLSVRHHRTRRHHRKRATVRPRRKCAAGFRQAVATVANIERRAACLSGKPSRRKRTPPPSEAATVRPWRTSNTPRRIPASRPPVYPATVCRVPLPACQRFDRAATIAGNAA